MSRAFVCCFGWKLPLKSNSDFATSLPQKGRKSSRHQFSGVFSVSFGGGEITITFLKRHPREPEGQKPTMVINHVSKSWDDPPTMAPGPLQILFTEGRFPKTLKFRGCLKKDAGNVGI